MKYTINPLFWGCFLSLFLSAAAVCAVDGVQALNLCALCFVIWLGLFLYQRSFIQRKDLFPNPPYGVMTKLSGVPAWIRWACFGGEIVSCLAFLCAYQVWVGAAIVAVIGIVCAVLGWRQK